MDDTSSPASRPRRGILVVGAFAVAALVALVAAGTVLDAARDTASVSAVGAAVTSTVTEPAAVPVSTATTEAPTTTTEEPTTTTTEAPTTTTPPPGPPAPGLAARPPPLGPGAATVFVLGDSVILGAQSTVPPALVGWSVTFDAKESRSIFAGQSLLQGPEAQAARVVVIHLCTNWGNPSGFGDQLDRALASIPNAQRVVLVTCTEWHPATPAANADIRAAATRYPSVVVADWAAISGTAGYTYSDGLHLKAAGAQAMADLVAAAVGPAP